MDLAVRRTPAQSAVALRVQAHRLRSVAEPGLLARPELAVPQAGPGRAVADNRS
jgi:hypothetical protein